jgi:hypothetical protein
MNMLAIAPPPGAGDHPSGPYLLPQIQDFFWKGKIATPQNSSQNIPISFPFFCFKRLPADIFSRFFLAHSPLRFLPACAPHFSQIVCRLHLGEKDLPQ